MAPPPRTPPSPGTVSLTRRSESVRAVLAHPSLDVMDFLNEVVSRYPEAISFAPGRPSERFFDVAGSLDELRRWVASTAPDGDEAAALDALGQYGRTNGIIHRQVARHLALDEGIEVSPEAVMVTCGCQEAMAVLLVGLFDPGRDVLLASDPTYIGITGLARLLGVEVRPVPSGEEGLEPPAVAAAAREVRRHGKRPRAIYDVPDFNNPLGTSLSPAARRRLLEVAREEDLLVFEDNPYRLFSYDGPPEPTLKALDEERRVVYLGSFSKTLFPGLRLGYLVADQPVEGPAGSRTLAAELSRVKSLTTVNTPPLLQAVAGAVLEAHGGSLKPVVEAKLPFYRGNRDRMLARLDEGARAAGLDARTLRWNRPRGGFFLTLDLAFPFDEEALAECAGRFGVICCPMSFFSTAGGRERQVRLSFSYVSPREIDEGVRRFLLFVRERSAP